MASEPQYQPEKPRSSTSKHVPSPLSTPWTSTTTFTSMTTSSAVAPNPPSTPPSPDEGMEHPPLPQEIPHPIELPRTPVTPGLGSPAGAFIDTSRGAATGLIRRVSRGARHKLRTRTSSSNVRLRDQSSGPTVLRARSNSKTYDNYLEVSDLELDREDIVPEGDHEPSSISAQTLQSPSLLPANLKKMYMGTDGELTPPPVLSQGTIFEKIMTKKRKHLKIWLHESLSKIVWCYPTQNAPRKSLYVDDIQEIRAGAEASNYLEEFDMPASVAAQWLTLIYVDHDKSKGRSVKSMHLIAPNTEICSSWRSFLLLVKEVRHDMMNGMAGNRKTFRVAAWRREMYRRFGSTAYSKEEEVVDFQGLKSFCRSFHIYKSDRELRQLFDKIDVNHRGQLGQEEYLDFFDRLTRRKDIEMIFDSIKPATSSTLSLADFITFLRRTQGIEVDDYSRWREIFHKCCDMDANSIEPTSHGYEMSSRRMTFDAFQAFILSDEYNPALGNSQPAPTFNRPLNEYFISSSHNTYLMGRQMMGESNPEGYTSSLKKGCRCVEIDCWDGDDGKPKVTHGKTFTNRCSFLDCIKVINKWAFEASPYPLVISLEVHCSPAQQRIMAENMKEQFGSKLLLAPLPDDNSILPSPEALKGMILIKVKMPTVDLLHPLQADPNPRHRRQRSKSEAKTSSTTRAPPPMPFSPGFVTSPTYRAATLDGPVSPKPQSGNNSPAGSSSSSDESELGDDRLVQPRKRSVATSNIIQELGDLGVYTRGLRFPGFGNPQSHMYNHIFSFNEHTFEEKCKVPEMKRDLELHNRRFLMRVYPKFSRFNSTNFDPLKFWRRGVQMAATNWQTPDLGTQINNAMFAAGYDRTGYVLKPDELRAPHVDGRKLRRRLVKFSVDILSAHWLEPPVDLRAGAEMNPYVEIEVYSADDRAKGIATAEGGMDASARNGMSGIGSPKRQRTKIISGNGYDPIFDQRINFTLETKYPSLVFVRWTVWSSPDCRSPSSQKDPIAMFTAKLSSLQTGWRKMNLLNKQQERVISTLLCRITKEQDQDLEPLIGQPPVSRAAINTKKAAEPMSFQQPAAGSMGTEDANRASAPFFKRVGGVFTRRPSYRGKKKDGPPSVATTSSTTLATSTTDDGEFTRATSIDK